MKMKHFYLIIVAFLAAFTPSLAQKELPVPPVPAIRQLHHDNILNSLQTMHVRSKLDVGTTIGFTLDARRD